MFSLFRPTRRLLARNIHALFFAPAILAVSVIPAQGQNISEEPSGSLRALMSQAKVLRADPVGKKIDSSLASMISEMALRGITRANAAARGAAALSNLLVRVDQDGRIQAYLHMPVIGPTELAALERHEVVVEIAERSAGLVQAWIPFDRLEEVAALNIVDRVTRPSYAHSRAGSVATEGDTILKAKRLRSTLGVDGSGVRVGVLSAGAENIAGSQASGDLPPGITTFGSCDTTVWSAVGCDEGTAMMEIVHDVAPGAELGFGAVATSLQFVRKLKKLVEDFRARVVVDDLGFLGEPFFADGRVAKAVAALPKRQVVFVSAAGNAAKGHYEKDFKGGSHLGLNLHNFGAAAGGGKDFSMNVRVQPGGVVLVVLQWADRFGRSRNDYDLLLVDRSESFVLCGFCASLDIQDGDDDPIEAIIYGNDTSSAVTGKILISKFDGTSRRLEMFIFTEEAAVKEYNIPAGSVVGHPAVPTALAVGAISASDPDHDDIRGYSSRGPSLVLFPEKRSRRKPDITGIDGVFTTGPGAFPGKFPGTSAAAPHVAGIAALLRELAPGPTAAEVRKAIKAGAFDLGPKGPDNTYGAGRANAVRAANKL